MKPGRFCGVDVVGVAFGGLGQPGAIVDLPLWLVGSACCGARLFPSLSWTVPLCFCSLLKTEPFGVDVGLSSFFAFAFSLRTSFMRPVTLEACQVASLNEIPVYGIRPAVESMRGRFGPTFDVVLGSMRGRFWPELLFDTGRTVNGFVENGFVFGCPGLPRAENGLPNLDVFLVSEIQLGGGVGAVMLSVECVTCWPSGLNGLRFLIGCEASSW